MKYANISQLWRLSDLHKQGEMCELQRELTSIISSTTTFSTEKPRMEYAQVW